MALLFLSSSPLRIGAHPGYIFLSRFFASASPLFSSPPRAFSCRVADDCVGASSRRDLAKRMPLPRASLTIRRGCRKIRDTRKSISTAVGSDGVSRKSHCVSVLGPREGERETLWKTDVLSSGRATRTSSGDGLRYICDSVERANVSCGRGLGVKRCFMRRFAAFWQCDRAARAKLRPPIGNARRFLNKWTPRAQSASGRWQRRESGECVSFSFFLIYTKIVPLWVIYGVERSNTICRVNIRIE